MLQFGGKDSKRHFTVVMEGKEHGLYVSSTPSSAAKKAVTKLCAANKSKKVEFEIREITQGSKKKTYGPYLGFIEKLKEPIELKGRVIRYKPVAKLSGKKSAKKGGMRGGVFSRLNLLPRSRGMGQSSNPYTYDTQKSKLSPFLSSDESIKNLQLRFLYSLWNYVYQPMGYDSNMSSDPKYEEFSDNDIKILVKIFNEELINISAQELLEYKQKQPEGKYFQ